MGAKKEYDSDKRRFLEMNSTMLAHAMVTKFGYVGDIKELVDKSQRIWDEIEHQYPRPERDR